ncbi:MAG: nitroreductase family protein [Chloroflexota bacterium]
MKKYEFITLPGYQEYSTEEMQSRARDFYSEIRLRRTVRDFSDKPVDKSISDECILVAGTAPNGANLQPWHFVVVSNPKIKTQIKIAAEDEEQEFYRDRAPQEWLEALAPLGTDEHKPFLETAPYLIIFMSQSYGINPQGQRVKNYYVKESVGIATGFLITALHRAGLVTLTHTPSPMNFLNEILGRPANEKPFLILVVGHPEDDAQVPVISKKSLLEISTYL